MLSPQQLWLSNLANDAFGSGERRLRARITQTEQSIGARLARLRRELALIRWMLAGIIALASLLPLLMPLVG